MNVFDDDFFFDSTPDEDPDSLWSTMKEAEEEDDKRRFYGISDQPTPQPATGGTFSGGKKPPQTG